MKFSAQNLFKSIRSTLPLAATLLAVTFASSGLSAAEQATTQAAEATNVSTEAEAIDLFAAIEAGQIEVKLTVRNGEKARIVTENKTKKPLTIKVPEAMAMVPILAQNQGGGGGGNNGGGIFNIQPEKFAKTDLNFLCLEHGDPNPRLGMQYQLRPIAEITESAAVVELIARSARGDYPHAASQAAAWHLQNGMSWEVLAAKVRTRHNSPNRPYFSAKTLAQAKKIVTQVEEATVEKPQPSTSSPQGSGYTSLR